MFAAMLETANYESVCGTVEKGTDLTCYIYQSDQSLDCAQQSLAPSLRRVAALM